MINNADCSWGMSRMKVRKRNGLIVEFEFDRIVKAIKAVGLCNCVAKRIGLEVEGNLKGEVVDVETIQDCVEKALMKNGFYKEAKAFILYRDAHRKIRDINVKDIVESYLGKKDWEVKENSNMAYSLQGLNNYVAGGITKQYWLENLYTEDVRNAYYEGVFHLHDLNLLSVYCVGWSLEDLLLEGFKGVPSKIESKPTKHLRSALGQVVNFFYTLQGEAAGAQAFSNFDTLLAPFIREDELSREEVRQCLQEFLFNVNVPTRVGFQSPFTNITLDVKVPKTLINSPVIIGGKRRELTYGDYQEEVKVFDEELFKLYAEGDASGRPFTFPIPTINIDVDFDWDACPELWRITAKYGIPYFANFINSEMSAEDCRSMCCRLRLSTKELTRKGGGLFGASPLTGSIGVCTLNLPHLADKALSEGDFFDGLAKAVLLASKSLEQKRKILERYTEEGLYPYSKFYLRKIKERDGSYWHNHFSTIGVIGANEAAEILLGEDITSKRGQAFAIKILKFIRKMLIDIQEQTGHFYNLEASPAESAAYRLALKDGLGYDYYTNSTQLPVGFTNDPFEAIELQDELQGLYSGGTVLHFFLGEAVANPDAVKTFVKKVCEISHLPYITVTPTFSICPTHGYLAGECKKCPFCGKKCEIYSRVIGYLRPVDQWNVGKQIEYNERKEFKV